MSNSDKIRQEIERRIKANKTKNGFPAGTICSIRIETYEGLQSFIDSLPEEKPSEDLEEAARRYAEDIWLSGTSWQDAARQTFIAGAQWVLRKTQNK